MSGHITKHKFMSNYLVCHQHREVQTPATAESDRSGNKDQINIGMEYDIGSVD
jgi:hypothetical protein